MICYESNKSRILFALGINIKIQVGKCRQVPIK